MVVAVFALGVSAARARRREVSESEERVFRFFNDRPGALHVPVWMAMQAGSLGGSWALAALIGRHRRSAFVRTGALATAVWAGVKLAKPLIGRGRAADHLDRVRVRGVAQSGLGYPSGHAAVSLTLALSVPGDEVMLQRALMAAALTTGAARMYVGAHLPYDVVGGFAIGAIAGRAMDLWARASVADPGELGDLSERV